MIEVQKDGRVLMVKLNQPPVNVLDTAICKELSRQLGEYARDESLAAVILSGAGKCFSAGASVEEHRREYAEEMVTALTQACRRIAEMPVPVIAQVHGFCFGGAFELVMHCDFVEADPSAVFGVPEITLAFFPPLACSALPGIVGRQNAAQMIFTGDSVDAERALAMGIVQKIRPTAEWEKLIRRFNNTSAPVLRIAKEALRLALDEPQDRFAEDITQYLFLQKLYDVEDLNEGIACFMEKRKPQWQHR